MKYLSIIVLRIYRSFLNLLAKHKYKNCSYDTVDIPEILNTGVAYFPKAKE